MKTIKRRLEKLEGRSGEQFFWLRMAPLEELEVRYQTIMGKVFGCKPEEVDMSPETLEIVEAKVKAELSRRRKLANA